MAPGKRKIETIDLTNSSDNEEYLFTPPRNKFAKPNVPLISSQDRKGHSTPYPTPPTSSQPASSQLPSSQKSGNGGPSTTAFRPAHYPAGVSTDVRDGWSASAQEIENDLRREIDLTQDFDDDVYENYELYGILDTKIVGCRFYDGRVTLGEYVTVRREPRNQYDSNAIRIDNVQGKQIGHIPRQVAAKLAGLVDSRDLLVEGAVTGPKGFYETPLALKLFGTTDPVAAAALKQRMQALRLPVTEHIRAEAERKKKAKELEKRRKEAEKAAIRMGKLGGLQIDENGDARYASFSTPGMAGEPQTMEELLSNAQVFNPREVQDVVNKFAAGEEVLEKMEMAEQPSAMKTILLPYQRQGLQWMLDHESPKLPAPGSAEPVQLWKNKDGLYMNIATSFATKQVPSLASGGILADDMGLGKTIQIISLIMADPHRTRQPTLVVAPLSVMSNWNVQACAHVRKKYALRVLIYHGPGKKDMAPKDFEDYDLVITTYQTMTLELFPNGTRKAEQVPSRKGLFSTTFRRLVLDEGHQIRNPKAKMCQAACSIMASSRWVLTGTPIVNSLKDLYSHVKFIRLSGGLSDFEIFNGTLIRPLKTGDPAASVLLQALMSTVCLRRMKDMKFIDLKLPEITSVKYPVTFLPHERERYDAFKSEAHGVLEQAKARKGNTAYSHLLEVLLRMRQTCNHWKMCGEERVNKLLELLEENKAVDIMDPANRRALQDLLQIRVDSQEDCPVCIDTMRNPVITACAHAFCTDCIEKVIAEQHKCPMCRAELADNSALVEPSAGLGESEDRAQAIEIDADTSSSKIEALIKILKASEKEPRTKTVVFSQWTSFLDILEKELEKHGMSFTRLDGKMPPSRRDAAIEALNSEPNCTIMLASLSVCSVGLNLVAANQVCLSHPIPPWIPPWIPPIDTHVPNPVFLGHSQRFMVGPRH
jgi:SWI/SNF-related matrix-associated actin-dependent regulator of chromatin subfamily A3